MGTIEHVFEPSRLLLVWHHSDDTRPRHRRVVAELIKTDDDVIFRYLSKSPDFTAAIDEGFNGFPAFPLNPSNTSYPGALDVFVRRLPPRKREDYREYLAQYNLPVGFSGSDFSLLGYTGARLASDTFELCPDLAGAQSPVDFVIEVSGAGYYQDQVSKVAEGDAVQLEPEPGNELDSNAVMIVHREGKIGYVNKALSRGIANLMNAGRIEANVIKVGSRRGKSRVLILVRYL